MPMPVSMQSQFCSCRFKAISTHLPQSKPLTGEGRLTEWENFEPLKRHVKQWRRSWDGCAGQYQGKLTFRGQQIMLARHSIECEDKQKPPKHGKNIANGHAQVAGGMVDNLFNDKYGKGTQNLVCHLASEYPRPKTEQNIRYFVIKGLYSATRYVCMYMPEDGINMKTVETDDGYSGSSKDHYCWSRGKSEEASRLFLCKRSCGCLHVV